MPVTKIFVSGYGGFCGKVHARWVQCMVVTVNVVDNSPHASLQHFLHHLGIPQKHTKSNFTTIRLCRITVRLTLKKLSEAFQLPVDTNGAGFCEPELLLQQQLDQLFASITVSAIMTTSEAVTEKTPYFLWLLGTLRSSMQAPPEQYKYMSWNEQPFRPSELHIKLQSIALLLLHELHFIHVLTLQLLVV